MCLNIPISLISKYENVFECKDSSEYQNVSELKDIFEYKCL